MVSSVTDPVITAAPRLAPVLDEILADPEARMALDAALPQVPGTVGRLSAAEVPALVGRMVAGAVDLLPADVLARLATALSLSTPPQQPAGFRPMTGDLPDFDPQGVPGLSVVTCCMNRNANLMRALPSWLAQDAVSEVIVVDWSSDEPVAVSLASAGIDDPRVKIVRVEGEDRWILSHAFNAGFRAASCDFVLKADADIVLAPGFFHANPVLDDCFLAGNWRGAGAGQAYVNGFFLASRRVLAAVGGFNEFIRSYGWDDDELYARLLHSGFRRLDVAAGTITHLDHDDAERLGDKAPAEAESFPDTLRASPIFHIRKNRYIATVMPDWTDKSLHIPFRIEAASENRLVLRRGNWDPSAVPAHVQAAAEHHALIEMGAWKLGRDILFLDPARALELLDWPEGQLTRIDILLALRDRMDVVNSPGPYVLLRTDSGILSSDSAATQAVLKDLVDRLQVQGFKPVFVAACESLPAPARDVCGDVAFLPDWVNLGPTTSTLPRLVYQGGLPRGQGVLRIAVNADTLDRLATLGRRHVAQPAVAVGRAKLFVDAQHGLGNRLRAIASAAAIARASDRDLVVVWEPDDHCNCRMSDLFDYPGAVIEERFLPDATARGLRIFNYMPNEPGAEKGARIKLTPGVDAYVRSAFVLTHPASTWDTENAFLRGLVPTAAVRDLVASVRSENDLAVHVRMEGGKVAEHLPYENPANWTADDHAKIEFWRKRSQPARFLKRINALMDSGKVSTLFLAADTAEAYERFAKRFRTRLSSLPRPVFDRSADQLRYALADAILLSRAPLLLGSNWSSFTELAQRLAPAPQVTEMSGKDF